jgi:hypothetical protein
MIAQDQHLFVVEPNHGELDEVSTNNGKINVSSISPQSTDISFQPQIPIGMENFMLVT